MAASSAETTSQTAWNSVDVAFTALKQDVFDAYAGSNIPAQKKANQLQFFFDKVSKLQGLVDESCSDFAGTGDPADFFAPLYDSEDICYSLNMFYASVKSFHTAFACNDADEKKTRKMTRLIQRQRNILFKRKLKQLNCNLATPMVSIEFNIKKSHWRF